MTSSISVEKTPEAADNRGDEAIQPFPNLHKTVLRYAGAVALVGIAHLIVVGGGKYLGPASTSVFLAAVIIASLYGGRGPGVLATALSALDLDYTFTSPFHSLWVAFDDFVWLLMFLAVALLSSSLQGRRLKAEESLRAAHHGLQRIVAEQTAELVRSQEQLALLMNGMIDQAVFMLDGKGCIANWNMSAVRLLGFDADQMIGQEISRISPQLSRPNPIEASEPDRGVVHEDQGWVVRKDGGKFWASMLMTPIQDAGGAACGSAVLIRDITERRTLEQEVVEISEREQQRIGKDLHDGLGQELTGIAMFSTALAELLRTENAPGAADAEEVADLVHETIKHTRDLARGLSPVDLEDEGLVSALRRLSERIGRLPGRQCTFEGSMQENLDVLVASHLFRIAQEAISNAVRHGDARHISIQLRQTDDELALIITDDGVGFAAGEKPPGMGLRLMEHRAKAVRGSISVKRRDAGGTVVECRLSRGRV